jgi:hypothetical protein
MNQGGAAQANAQYHDEARQASVSLPTCGGGDSDSDCEAFTRLEALRACLAK